MTNSMVPYSFIPGTKAKASEVNANFIALANLIDANKEIVAANNLEIIELMKDKADKIELITEHTITEDETDLNDYKIKGTYIFTEQFKPLNTPSENVGMLAVYGDIDSKVKQIWFENSSSLGIYIRDFENFQWSDWKNLTGSLNLDRTGYFKLSGGLLLQWGCQTTNIITYPVAYTAFVCPLFSKNGWNASFERSDSGIDQYSLTGFSVGSAGVFNSMNWIVLGY